jgi:hypothetical protein
MACAAGFARQFADAPFANQGVEHAAQGIGVSVEMLGKLSQRRSGMGAEVGLDLLQNHDCRLIKTG